MISAADILRRVRRGDLTPEAAIRESQDAIAERDGEVGAFARLAPEIAAGRGPLAGLAVGVKDIVDTADMATEMGSPVYAGWRPKGDAPVVSGLRRLGATAIGKTTTTAFASLDPTATRNPRDLNHTPGGSSAGSAAAVAAGMVPVALGTQTGGSIIRPASFCGVAAIKPSFRLLPTVGVKCYSWTLDTVGLFAAGVEDLAEVLALLTGRAELRAAPAGPGLSLGVLAQDPAGAPDPAGAEALWLAAGAAERAGAVIRDLALPQVLHEAWSLHRVIEGFEARQALAWEWTCRRADLAPLIGARLDEAQGLTPAEYDGARSVAHRARGTLHGLFREEGAPDVLLAVSAPGAAPEGLGSTGDARFNRLWTLMGVPCVAVPVWSGGALPLGVQVVAPFGRDALALAAARFLEGALRRAA